MHLLHFLFLFLIKLVSKPTMNRIAIALLLSLVASIQGFMTAPGVQRVRTNSLVFFFRPYLFLGFTDMFGILFFLFFRIQSLFRGSNSCRRTIQMPS